MSRGTVPGLASPYRIAEFLPSVYQEEDPFVLRFTAGLDDVWAPVLATLDNLDAYLDPDLTPEDFLGWLGGWVGAVVDEATPLALRRAAVGQAAALHRSRGTPGGLRALIELLTGGEVQVADSGGARLVPDAGHGTARRGQPVGERAGDPRPGQRRDHVGHAVGSGDSGSGGKAGPCGAHRGGGESMIVCKTCGYRNGDQDAFCGSCGAFLEWTGEKVAPAATPQPEPEEEPAAKRSWFARMRTCCTWTWVTASRRPPVAPAPECPARPAARVGRRARRVRRRYPAVRRALPVPPVRQAHRVVRRARRVPRGLRHRREHRVRRGPHHRRRRSGRHDPRVRPGRLLRHRRRRAPRRRLHRSAPPRLLRHRRRRSRRRRLRARRASRRHHRR